MLDVIIKVECMCGDEQGVVATKRKTDESENTFIIEVEPCEKCLRNAERDGYEMRGRIG